MHFAGSRHGLRRNSGPSKLVLPPAEAARGWKRHHHHHHHHHYYYGVFTRGRFCHKVTVRAVTVIVTKLKGLVKSPAPRIGCLAVNEATSCPIILTVLLHTCSTRPHVNSVFGQPTVEYVNETEQRTSHNEE